MNSKVVKNYAQTLFDIAETQVARMQILQELFLIEKIMKSDCKVQEFLYSAAISKSEKEKLIGKVFKGASLSDVTLNFIKVLAKNGRMDYLSGINLALQRLIENENKEKIATVKYAREFTAKDKKDITEFLEVKYGNKFVVSFEKDETLIAGIVINFDNVVIDASVKGMMTDLNEQLDDAYLQSIN